LIRLSHFAKKASKFGRNWAWIGKISKGKLAEYVEKKYSDISSFLKKCGYDENEDYSIAYRTA